MSEDTSRKSNVLRNVLLGGAGVLGLGGAGLGGLAVAGHLASKKEEGKGSRKGGKWRRATPSPIRAATRGRRTKVEDPELLRELYRVIRKRVATRV